MGVQRLVHGLPVVCVFPPDFSERLELFLNESGLSTRALARLLGVSPDRIRRWRKRGVAPSSAHLFPLLTIADVMGLRDGILMRPDRDLPEGVDPETLRRWRTGSDGPRIAGKAGAVGVQRRVDWLSVVCVRPPDFSERLALFERESGLSTRALARLLGVNPDRIRKWRKRGVAPSPAHLFLLLTIAEAMGLRDGILMRPDRDLPEGMDAEALRR